MGQLFAAFGIDWRLLIINLVNFGLLLLALWYFLYTPLLTMLESRRQKVAQGVRDAEDAHTKLHEVEEARSGILASAGQEADEMLKKARTNAAQKEHALVAAAEAAAARTNAEAQKQALELKAQALEESKQEVAKLVVLGMEKMMVK